MRRRGPAPLVLDAEVRGAVTCSALAALGATATLALLGTPIAWHLAGRGVPARGLVEARLDLPLAIPHPLAGLTLLLVLGREAAVGGALLALGLRVIGTPLGMGATMLFVAAPLYVSATRASVA